MTRVTCLVFFQLSGLSIVTREQEVTNKKKQHNWLRPTFRLQLSHRVAQQRRHAGLRCVTDGGEVMAALQRHNDAPTRQTHQQLRQLAETCQRTAAMVRSAALESTLGGSGYRGRRRILTLCRDVVSPERRLVTLHRVEARGHQNHVGAELLGDGHHHTPARQAHEGCCNKEEKQKRIDCQVISVVVN